MNMIDAVVVALVGMGVVFTGLLLTSLTIWSFSVVPPLWKKLTEKNKAAAIADANSAQPAVPVASPVPDPDVFAVIVTVLEVERRLHFAERMSRYTFRNR